MAHPPLRLPLYGEPVVATSGGEGASAAERDASTSSASTAHSSSPALPAPASGPALVDEADRNEALMQVGDLARETGKTVRALHLYEELQLLRPVARSKGRYRLYGPEALVRIRWIGKLQEMGFSLTDIQTIVKDWEHSGSAPHAMVKMREVYEKKLEETRAHLQRLEALEHDLQASLTYLDTCDVCDPARLLSSCRACDLHSCNTHVPDLVAGFRAN